MRNSLKFGCIMTLCLAVHAQADDVVVVLQDGHDGFRGTRDATVSVDPRISDLNLGADSQLGIWQHDGTAFIKFDFDYSDIPADAAVKAATLELYCLSEGFSEEEIKRPWQVAVYECTVDWREGSGTPTTRRRDGVSLNTPNGRNPWPNGSHLAAGKALGEATLRGRHLWYKWSIDPALVTNWIAGRENYGLVIWGKAPGKAVSFASRDWPSIAQRPILRLQLSLTREQAKSLQRAAAVRRMEAAKPDHLVPKTTYRLSKETVMMPHYDVEKALKLGTSYKKRPANSMITILDRKELSNRIWYHVTAKGKHGQGGDEGWINGLVLVGQQLEIIAESGTHFREPNHLGVSRSTAVSLFKKLDSTIQFSRGWPMLGQPLQVGRSAAVHVNLVGPSEDLAEVAFSFDVKDVPTLLTPDDGLSGLIGQLQPNWPNAIGWIKGQLHRARSEAFSEISIQNNDSFLSIEQLRGTVFVSLETKSWRNQKAPE